MNSLYFCTGSGRPRFRRAVHVVEQADPQVAGKAFVDEFERRHAPADDALLRAEVVGTRGRCHVILAGRFGCQPLPVTPLSRASTSSCERKSALIQLIE
jgi:hypothetical protein